MKNILFINTETNGLPKKGTYDVTEKNYEKWPHLVSLHYKIGTYDKKKNNIEIKYKRYFLIKPDNFKISKESIAFHGITNKKARINGNNIKLVLKKLRHDIEKYKVKIIVGHNINFDLNVLKAEIIRSNLDINLNLLKVDTIKFYHNYEYPKLGDLHVKLFNREFNKSHPRKSNINIIIKCFNYLYSEHIKSIKKRKIEK
jgi:DNA polymerase III subunit alpha